MKKVLAVLIFLIGAFIGVSTQTGLYGDISTLFTFIIIALSIAIMRGAIYLWKSKSAKTNTDF